MINNIGQNSYNKQIGFGNRAKTAGELLEAATNLTMARNAVTSLTKKGADSKKLAQATEALAKAKESVIEAADGNLEKVKGLFA